MPGEESEETTIKESTFAFAVAVVALSESASQQEKASRCNPMTNSLRAKGGRHTTVKE